MYYVITPDQEKPRSAAHDLGGMQVVGLYQVRGKAENKTKELCGFSGREYRLVVAADRAELRKLLAEEAGGER